MTKCMDSKEARFAIMYYEVLGMPSEPQGITAAASSPSEVEKPGGLLPHLY